MKTIKINGWEYTTEDEQKDIIMNCNKCKQNYKMLDNLKMLMKLMIFVKRRCIINADEFRTT